MILSPIHDLAAVLRSLEQRCTVLKRWTCDMSLRCPCWRCRFLADIHCFTLANVLRHPIIIYGDKMAAMSGLAGIYLPLLWDDPAGVSSPGFSNHLQAFPVKPCLQGSRYCVSCTLGLLGLLLIGLWSFNSLTRSCMLNVSPCFWSVCAIWQPRPPALHAFWLYQETPCGASCHLFVSLPGPSDGPPSLHRNSLPDVQGLGSSAGPTGCCWARHDLPVALLVAPFKAHL